MHGSFAPRIIVQVQHCTHIAQWEVWFCWEIPA